MVALHPAVLAAGEEGARGRRAWAILLDAGELALVARVDINLANVHHRQPGPRYGSTARPALFRTSRRCLAPSTTAAARALFWRRLAEPPRWPSSRQRYPASGVEFYRRPDRGQPLTSPLAGRLRECWCNLQMGRWRRSEAESVPGHLARLIVEHAEALESAWLPERPSRVSTTALPRLIAAETAFEVGRGWLWARSCSSAFQRYAEAEADPAAVARRFAELAMTSPRARVDVLRGELLIAAGRTDVMQQPMPRLGCLGDRPLAAAVRDITRGWRSSAATGPRRRAFSTTRSGRARRLDVPTLRRPASATGEVRARAPATCGAIADSARPSGAVERVRHARADCFRAAFLGNRIAVHQDLVRAILDRVVPTRSPRASFVAEQAKSQALLDLVRGAVEFAAAGLIGMAGAARSPTRARRSAIPAAPPRAPSNSDCRGDRGAPVGANALIRGWTGKAADQSADLRTNRGTARSARARSARTPGSP